MVTLRSVCVCSLLLAAGIGHARQAVAPAEVLTLQQAGTERDSAGLDEDGGMIHLDVTVTDKAGKPQTGLGRASFTLLDNGQPVQIRAISTSSEAAPIDPPSEVILVMDEANHSGDEVSEMRRGVEAFLRRDDGHLAHPVSVFRRSAGGLSSTEHSSTDGNRLAELVAKKNGLKAVAVGGDELPSGIRSMAASDPTLQMRTPYRAQSSINALGSIVLLERRRAGRKVVVWIGFNKSMNENSFEWITEFSTRMREARIQLFSVDFYHQADRIVPTALLAGGDHSEAERNAQGLLLPVLATQSGGGVLEEPDNDLGRLIAKCTESANTFYRLSFESARTTNVDEYHALKVLVNDPDLEVHANGGYYDEPVYHDQARPGVEQVTVAQLEQRLQASGGSDEDKAKRLGAMELTERMSAGKLLAWKPRLHARAWAALVGVADDSVFLAPPAEEVVDRARPDVDGQRAMLTKTIDYLGRTIPRLPDFFARRTTTTYEEPPTREEQTWKTVAAGRMLRPTGSSTVTVLYRGGYEAVDFAKGKEKRQARAARSSLARGVFGPILRVVIGDAARSRMTWSRWENSPNGALAVFHYNVPAERSHYDLTYRGVAADGDGVADFRRISGYEGEIEIDPETGAIFRMTVEGVTDPKLPVRRSGIMVEYGPVEIGGSQRICLVRSVSIARMRTIHQLSEWGETLRVHGPYETMLDDVSFGEYHMFHGEARILTGYEEQPKEK